jgi:hypothetical protein
MITFIALSYGRELRVFAHSGNKNFTNLAFSGFGLRDARSVITLIAMNVTPDGLKEWLNNQGKDRHWLADEIGVAKRTLDNWFSTEFPLYAVKAIERLDRELNSPQPADDSINLTISQWRELAKRARECGFDDEMEYVNALLRESLTEPAAKTIKSEKKTV